MTFFKSTVFWALMATTPMALADQMTPPTQAVMLGGDASFDACSSYGMVDGLKDVAGNFLALRGFPGTQGEMIAKLENKQDLWMCQEQNGWFGVVIPDGDTDCAVSSPIADSGPIYGPLCQWLGLRQIRFTTGWIIDGLGFACRLERPTF